MGLRKLFPCLKKPKPKPNEQTQNNQQTQNQPPKEPPEQQPDPGSGSQPPKIPPVSDLPSTDNSPATQEKPSQEGPTKPLASEVWNRAYDELANDEDTKELVEAYMKAIKKASKPADASAPEDDEDVSGVTDQAERDKMLQGAIKSGQERIHKYTSATNAVGKVSSFVLKFKGVVDLAVGTNPQAALPWAGVCIGLSVSCCSHNAVDGKELTPL